MRADARLTISGAGAATLAVPPSVLRVLGWCVAVALMAAALLPAVPRLLAPRAPLTLAIAGDLSRVSAEEVRRVVAPYLHADPRLQTSGTSFYELDLPALKAAAETLPWVARARVERTWPAQVRVHIREHRAVARWGDRSLLSDDDRVFTPKAIGSDLADLPRLSGPDGQQHAVHAAFGALRERLAGTPFLPTRLSQNARGAWTAVTADGIELRLGRGAPVDAAALLAGPVHAALAGRLTEVTYVDLHYFNGFAVGWRQRADDARPAGAGPESRNE